MRGVSFTHTHKGKTYQSASWRVTSKVRWDSPSRKCFEKERERECIKVFHFIKELIHPVIKLCHLFTHRHIKPVQLSYFHRTKRSSSEECSRCYFVLRLQWIETESFKIRTHTNVSYIPNAIYFNLLMPYNNFVWETYVNLCFLPANCQPDSLKRSNSN